MKTLSPGTEVVVLYKGRFRHAIVLTVTDQDTITARIGRTATGTVTRKTRAKTRASYFS